MNDIYEYKARKYKHKYLKLKREYIAQGGMRGRITINKVLSYFDKEPLVIDKQKNKRIDNNNKASKEQQIFKKKLILLRDNIINIIEEFYKKDQILGNINYDNIFSNNKNFNFKINLITDINTTFKFNTDKPVDIINFENEKNNHVEEIKYYKNENEKDNIEHIQKIQNTNDIRQFCFKYFLNIDRIPKTYNVPVFKIYMKDIFKIIIQNNNSHPPILIWFYNLFKTQLSANQKDKYIIEHYIEDTYITKIELYNALETLGTDEKTFLKEFKIYFDKCVYNEKMHNNDTKYEMSNIFGYCIIIKPYIKNIDYYSLTILICKLYEEFTKYYVIVENITEDEDKYVQKLPGLFKNLKDQYYNHEIEKNTFLTQLNVIIDCIKD